MCEQPNRAVRRREIICTCIVFTLAAALIIWAAVTVIRGRILIDASVLYWLCFVFAAISALVLAFCLRDLLLHSSNKAFSIVFVVTGGIILAFCSLVLMLLADETRYQTSNVCFDYTDHADEVASVLWVEFDDSPQGPDDLHYTTLQTLEEEDFAGILEDLSTLSYKGPRTMGYPLSLNGQMGFLIRFQEPNKDGFLYAFYAPYLHAYCRWNGKAYVLYPDFYHVNSVKEWNAIYRKYFS